MTPRRILWWCLTTALALTSAAVVAVGAWHLVDLGIPRADSPRARQEAMAAAKSHTEQLFSYTADRVEAQFDAAAELTTGTLRDDYSRYTRGIIQAVQRDHVTAVATVVASSVVSLTASSATVLEFVNATSTSDTEPSSSTASAFRVGMQRHGTSWLVESLQRF